MINLSAQVKQTPAADDYNTIFKALKWRSIGPFRGGRSNCGTGVVGDAKTYYMGTTGGGLWKTDDMGISWRNVSDGFSRPVPSAQWRWLKAIRTSVYVGMGEHAVRGVMTHPGDGVYKSTDAAKTWKKIGLDLTQHISRIVIDPKNPNIVLVAAQGALYAPSKERGIYKSTDGGTTWKNVLFVNDKTGSAELSMDMNESANLVRRDVGARPPAMESHQRRPGSGLYKSTDQGETWEKMKEGLPEEMGKMAIAVSRSNPEKVYALIESDSDKEAGGLFVSNDCRQEVEPDHQRSPPGAKGVVLHRTLHRPEERRIRFM